MTPQVERYTDITTTIVIMSKDWGKVPSPLS